MNTNEEWAVEHLARIKDFLVVARRFGFAVTATPAAHDMLRRSSHADAPRLAANVCPVVADPWDSAMSAMGVTNPPQCSRL